MKYGSGLPKKWLTQKKNTMARNLSRVLTIIWNLSMKVEMYMEEGFEKISRNMKAVYRGYVPLEELAEILRSAEYVVNDPEG